MLANPSGALVDPRHGAVLRQGLWDDAQIEDAGLRVVDADLVTIGGGLGSFALVDFLRIAGIEAPQVRVLSSLSKPYENFLRLALASQLRLEDRLRSDSSSTIHNIWGWPGYALSEAWAERSLLPLWQVVTEPLLSEYFTPRLRTVIEGLDREAARIGWDEMRVPCWAELVRRRTDGGYFVLVRRTDAGHDEGPGCEHDDVCVYRTQFVHLALGHPGPCVLPDVREFRARHPSSRRVVNAYDLHEHVYAELVATPGRRVVVRGSGIAASRILERLIHDRDAEGARTEIVHLFRSYVRGPKGPPWFRRPAGDGFSYQPFSFPRAAGGGQLRRRMLKLSAEERAALTLQMGGTTTPRRRGWQQQLARGRRAAWYRAQGGELSELDADDEGRLHLRVACDDGSELELDADFLIDATGLEGSVDRHSLIADLLEQGGASLNPLGRLDVEPSFELPRMRSGYGRVYASGAATLGGTLAPVDSFWGLTHAAMEITDDLADREFCEFPGVLRSLVQWWRWMRGQPP